MGRRERTGISPALAASALLHGLGLVAAIYLVDLFKAPFQLGGGVPVTLVSDAPPELKFAPQADEDQEAQAETPDPLAEPDPIPPEPELVPSPTPTPTPVTPKKPAPRPTPKSDLDLDRLLRDVQPSSRPRPPAKPPRPAGGAQGPSRAETAVKVGSGKRVSAATQGYLLDLGGDLSRRWNPNCLVEGGADVGAVVRFRVTTGGRLLGPPVSSEENTTNAMVRVASERAKRAVYASEPFRNFPPELYGEELIYPFDAAAACKR